MIQPGFTPLLLAHLAIPFVTLIHGALIAVMLQSRITLSDTHDKLVGVVVTGFALSILINTALATLLAVAGLSIHYLLGFLLLLDVLLAIYLIIDKQIGINVTGGSSLIWIIASVVFIIMVNNGGLINILADSWWHMSLANQIHDSGTIFSDQHHFNGNPKSELDFVYEPGWHISLALIAKLSNAPLPLVWHTLGAWCSALTVLSYYYFARVLTEDNKVALGAVVLFVVLLGGINAFFRVSPWPGNVAYIFLYLSIAYFFALMDQIDVAQQKSIDSILPVRVVIRSLVQAPVLTITTFLIIITIAVVHLAEGLWLVAAFIFYAYFLSSLQKKRAKAESDAVVIQFSWILFFLFWGVLIAVDHSEFLNTTIIVLAYLTINTIAIRLLTSTSEFASHLIIRIVASGVIMISTLWFIDINHLAELFRPEIIKTGYYSDYIPIYLWFEFDEVWLNLPKWEHQLRVGLLFSGVVSVMISFWLVAKEQSRATIFLFGCAIFSSLILISPYLFTFFGLLVSFTGVYRFEILIFHPVIIAMAILYIYRQTVVDKHE